MSSAVLPANVCDDGMSETDGTESGAVQNFYKEESYIMKILFYDTQSYDKESWSGNGIPENFAGAPDGGSCERP